jgi:ribose transport system permease protein/putative xylitol transport system permease protein
MMTMLHGMALFITGGLATPIRNETYNWLANGRMLGKFPNVGLWSLVIYGTLLYINFQTRFGRCMYAIGGDEKVSQLSGLPVDKYKILAFTFSGMLAGLTGALLAARLGSGTPELGMYLMFESITAIVIGGTAITGGIGGLHRTILGVLVITILSNGMNIIALHPYTQTIIKGCVILIAVGSMLERRKIGLIK